MFFYQISEAKKILNELEKKRKRLMGILLEVILNSIHMNNIYFVARALIALAPKKCFILTSDFKLLF